MAKPSSNLDWTVGNPNFGTVTVEPSPAKKEQGWGPDERPPRQFFNWLFYRIDEWIKYLDSQVDAFAGQSTIYDAYVGANGTHADINALMADPGIANIKNVLINSAIALDNTQVINQDGMNFTFLPQASFTKNGPTGATIASQIDAARVRIIDGRFIGFNNAGNKAIEVLGNNNMVTGCFFNTCNTEIDNQGANNITTNNLSEI